MSNTLNLVQIVGYLAMAAGISSRFFKQDGPLLLLSTICGFLFFIHFWMLDETAAALANGLGAIRFLLAYRFRNNPKHWVNVSAFISVLLYFIWFAISHPMHLNNYLVVIVTLVMGIGTIFFTGIPLRISFMIGDIIWLTISVLAGSIGGFAMDAITFVVTSITVYRMVQANRFNAITADSKESTT